MADELLDVVSEEDVVTGQEMRSAVHRLGLWHRGVHVFLFTQNGKMLIQKRSADRASSPSLLDCSVSEHVKATESYLDAAIRGMKEELGLHGITIKPLIKFRMNYGVNDNEVSILYEGMVDAAQVSFDLVEIESIQYLSIEELGNMMQMESSIFCGWFIEILNAYLGTPSHHLHLLETFRKRRVG